MLLLTSSFLAASEEAVELWREKLLEAENMLKQLEERLVQLEQENKQLQEIIDPFRDQLESYEIEKNSLLSQVETSVHIQYSFIQLGVE